MSRRWGKLAVRGNAIMAIGAASAAVALAGCGSSSKSSSTTTTGTGSGGANSAQATMPGLMHAGTLTVGMDLQFKPEMYVNNGQPAGYDVDLLKALAAYAHVKLKIVNLAFTGLIPGLQTKKFDLVSVGLSNTPARSQVVTFTVPYVPYALIIGVPKSKASTITSAAQLNKSGNVITALLGSTDQTVAEKTFPKAKINALADQNSAFSLVATGRANAIVVEDYLLSQYNQANAGDQLGEANVAPLDVQYGSWAVQHGNGALVKYLNSFLCTDETNGTLARLYERDFSVKTFPGVHACR